MLGFDKSYLLYENNASQDVTILSEEIKGVEPQRTLDINAGVHALYIYSDIVKPSIVGDTSSQILRVVRVENALFGDTIQKIFDQPHYFPLNTKEFETIEVEIRDDTGQLICFEEGRVIVVLNFKNELL